MRDSLLLSVRTKLPVKHAQCNLLPAPAFLPLRSPYQRGGIVTQHKGSKTLAFKPLGQAIAEPGEFLLSDFSKASCGRRLVCVAAPGAVGLCAAALTCQHAVFLLWEHVKTGCG